MPVRSKTALRMRLRTNLIAYSLIFPGLLVFYLFVIYPLLQTVAFSLYRYGGVGSLFESTFVGLRHFADAFVDEKFGRAIVNTFYFSIIHTLTKLTLAFLLAFFLYRKMTGWKWFQVGLYMPAIVPIVVSAVIWRFIYEGNFGLLNYLLRALHMERFQHYWLSEAATAMNAVIVSSVWFSMPFAMLVLFSYMLRIPNDLLEAAKIDGASTRQIVAHIIFPLMIPALLLMSILSIADDFKGYAYILLFTNGGPVGKTEVVGLYAYKQAFSYGNFGYASALSILVLAFLIVLSLGLVNRMKKNQFEF
jgi:ABC-type sugar transport system permease subunit